MSRKQDQPNQPEQAKTAEQKRQEDLAAQRERNRMRFGASAKGGTTPSQPGLETTATQGQPTTPVPLPTVGYQQPGQQVIYVPVTPGQPMPGQIQQQALPPQVEQGAPAGEIAEPEEEELEPPLYKQFITRPPAEWVVRDFDRKYQKGGYVYNPLLVGAVEAIGEILDYKKYKLFEEMMLDFIGKYNGLLEEREDIVRLVEEKYKSKHDLYTKKEREQLLKKKLKELNP